MAIENAKYIKDNITDKVNVINCTWDGKGLSIPMNEGNRHYQAILEWAKIDGNTIADAD
jgi:hypothetical protein